MTLYLDRAAIAMFRKMGTGYQARINRILETWLRMKMAETAVFRKEVIEAVGDARADARREDVGEGMQELYAKVLGHWAYEEGFRDGVERGGEE